MDEATSLCFKFSTAEQIKPKVVLNEKHDFRSNLLRVFSGCPRNLCNLWL